MVRGPAVVDQRHINARNPTATVLEVEAAWAKHRLPTWISPAPSQPGYVSLNRWVADCPECGSGAAAWPANPVARCFGCGAIFHVRFPADWAEGIRVLEERAQKHRHWHPDRETVDDLKVENLTHGDPI